MEYRQYLLCWFWGNGVQWSIDNTCSVGSGVVEYGGGASRGNPKEDSWKSVEDGLTPLD